MLSDINWKKNGVFILLAFGISWTFAGLLYILNISLGSITSTVILAVLFMPGPAVATFIIQKFIYKEGFKKYGWNFEKKSWKWVLFTPLLFLALFLLIILIIAVLGNTSIYEEFGRLDFSQEGFNDRFRLLMKGRANLENIVLPSFPPDVLFFLLILQGIVAGSTVNVPFMFGEEFGWRGLLLRETQKMGFLLSSIFIGIVWGLWHLPIVLMGHNYPKYPYLGIIMMCLFTTAISPLFSYIRIKSKTILGPCMLHGMINATGAIFIFFVSSGNELFSSIAGLAGVIAGTIVTIAIFIFDQKFIRDFKK